MLYELIRQGHLVLLLGTRLGVCVRPFLPLGVLVAGCQELRMHSHGRMEAEKTQAYSHRHRHTNTHTHKQSHTVAHTGS